MLKSASDMPVPEPAAETTGRAGAFESAGRDPIPIKSRIIDAAFDTLKEEGFAGTSARAIARRGKFNQALIFYHFGTLNDLLLAALDKTSAERMARYREALGSANGPDEKIDVATRLYREDLSSGYITVISELVAGSLSRPDLAPEVVGRLEPWIDFAAGVIEGLISQTPLEGLVDVETIALGVVACYLGIDLLSHLDPGNWRFEALFQLVGNLRPLVSPILEPGQ